MRRLGWIVGVAVALWAFLFVLRSERGAHEGSSSDPSTNSPASTREAGADPVSPTAASSAREDSSAPSGPVTLVGRLVDVDGLPFRELAVALRASGAAPLETRTNGEGAFEFRALARAAIELDLGAAFDASVPLGQRTLACRLDPLPFDLSAGPALLDVGTHVLPRSRPCWIEGGVVLDEEWAGEKGVWLGDVRIELETPPLDELGEGALPRIFTPPGAPPDWRSPPWRQELPPFPTLEGDGTFRFAVETPHDPFLVRAWVKRFEPAGVLVNPVPDGVLTEAFALPVE